MSKAYYNEIDPGAAAWLRELIKADLIAPGDVDERSIEDVLPRELVGYTQCHFFAGIGVWSYALRRAGWPDSRPVWTGSCPCQPFSAAGKGAGFDDERHLWPALFWLIQQSEPLTFFGEQVASDDGETWLDLVHDDLEAIGFRVGAVDLPACSVGTTHRRQRFFFVADAANARRDDQGQHRSGRPSQGPRSIECGAIGDLADALRSGRPEGWTEPRDRSLAGSGSASYVANAELSEWGQVDSARGRVQRQDGETQRQEGAGGFASGCEDGDLGDAESERLGETRQPSAGPEERADLSGDFGLMGDAGGSGLEIGTLPDGRQGVVRIKGSAFVESGVVGGFWGDADAILCNDPDGWKWRLVEPSTFPLAHGAAARMVRLRGYGNAINAEVATEFIKAYIEEIKEK